MARHVSSACWKLITLSEDRKAAICDICKHELVYNSRSTSNMLEHLRRRHPFEISLYDERQPKRFPSVCWKLVTLQEDCQTCVCNICKFELVYNKKSTTNLLRHLRSRHPSEYAAEEEKQSEEEKLSELVDTYKYSNDDTQSAVRVATDKQSTDGIATSSQPSTPETTSESTTSISDPVEKHDHMSTNGHDGNASVRSTPSLSTIASKQKRQPKRFPSVCWKLVTLQEDCQTCVCNICKFELVYNKKSNTNLLRHLRLRHPSEYAAEEEKQSEEEKLSELVDTYKYSNDDTQSTVRVATDKQSTDGKFTSSQPSTPETTSESTPSTSDPIEKHDHISAIGHDGNTSVTPSLSTIASKQERLSKRFSSVCWKLVTLQEDCQTCVCNICKFELVYNTKSTTNLLRHLRSRHPSEYAAEEEKQSEEEKLSELVDTYKYSNDDTQSTVRVATDKQSTDGIATSSQPSTPETTSESTTSTSDPIEKHDHISAIGHDGNASVTPSLSTIASKQERLSKRFSIGN